MMWHCYQPVSGTVGSILGHTGGWGHHVVQGSIVGDEAIGKTEEKGKIKRKGCLEKKTCHGSAIMLHAHGSASSDERGVGKGDQKWLGMKSLMMKFEHMQKGWGH